MNAIFSRNHVFLLMDFFFLFKLMSLLCRIKFYTQEIVLFRQDLLYRMRRSSLIPPSTEETSDPFEHVSTQLLFFIESEAFGRRI